MKKNIQILIDIDGKPTHFGYYRTIKKAEAMRDRIIRLQNAGRYSELAKLMIKESSKNV